MKRKTKHKKTKSKEKIDSNTLKRLITVLDGYRVHDYTDIEFIDKAVAEGKLGSNFNEEWKEIRGILMKMASSAASIPNLVELIKIRDVINLVSMIVMTAAFVLLIVQIAFKQSSLGLPGEYIFLSAFALLLVSIVSRFLINRKIGIKIEEYHAENPEELGNELSRLKEKVQNFLLRLSRNIVRLGEDPDAYKMRLYNADYKRIRIVQEPSRFKRYYVVVPKT